MTTHPADVKTWHQLPLFPANVIELSLKVGIVLDGDHYQAQIEARDAVDGNLIAMRSWPHWNGTSMARTIADVGRAFTELLYELSEPFPSTP